MATSTIYQENVTAAKVTINALNCCACGVVFGLSDAHENTLRRSGQTFYCPNGHSMTFGEGDISRARQRTRDAEASAKEWEAYSKQLADDLMDAAKEAKRLKRRATAGMCSVCRRSFQNVKRHMDRQHA